MKCNIAQDLLPLYAEGLCSEETSRELEEHFAECKDCSALKNGLPLPGKGGEKSDKEIKPFKKIHRRLKVNIFVIIALGLVAAAVLFFLGGLTYGELNPHLNSLSFSRIAHIIEVRQMAGLLEKGDIDGFAERMHDPETWFADSAANFIAERFKTAYKEELGSKSCKIINVDTITVEFANNVYGFESNVTFDFDGEHITFLFKKSGNEYKVSVADGGEELRSMSALNVFGAIDDIIACSGLMSRAPSNFVPLFSGNGYGEIAELYKLFEKDGSEIVYAYASAPQINYDKDVLQSQCCFKFRDGGGNTAIFEFTADLDNYILFSADMSTVSTINQGMSDEKLEQIYDILKASA